MPHLIHLALHPPRFIRGGIRVRDDHRDERTRSFDDHRLFEGAREHERDLEREAR